VAPAGASGMVGGKSSFFNSGTSGRGRGALGPGQLQRYEQQAAIKLTPDCAHWLKTGELPD